jgi:hypothetical protein
LAYRIEDKTIKKTVHCRSNFNCLTERDYPICAEAIPLCSVESCDAESELLYVQTTRYLYCSYMHIYDTGFICTCPVRYEIYKRYNC